MINVSKNKDNEKNLSIRDLFYINVFLLNPNIFSFSLTSICENRKYLEYEQLLGNVKGL